jgi:hypothetical protein
MMDLRRLFLLHPFDDLGGMNPARLDRNSIPGRYISEKVHNGTDTGRAQQIAMGKQPQRH